MDMAAGSVFSTTILKNVYLLEYADVYKLHENRLQEFSKA